MHDFCPLYLQKIMCTNFYIIKGDLIYGRRNGTKNTRMA